MVIDPDITDNFESATLQNTLTVCVQNMRYNEFMYSSIVLIHIIAAYSIYSFSWNLIILRKTWHLLPSWPYSSLLLAYFILLSYYIPHQRPANENKKMIHITNLRITSIILWSMISSYFYQGYFRRSLGDIRCFPSLWSFTQSDTCQQSYHGEKNADMINRTSWALVILFIVLFSTLIFIHYFLLVSDVASSYPFDCNSSRFWQGSAACNLLSWIRKIIVWWIWGTVYYTVAWVHDSFSFPFPFSLYFSSSS